MIDHNLFGTSTFISVFKLKNDYLFHTRPPKTVTYLKKSAAACAAF